MSAAPQIRTALVENLKALHLPTMRDCFEEAAQRAEKETLSYEQYLLELSERECEARRHNRIASLLRESGLPREKTMANFNLKRLPVKAGRQLKALLDGGFLDRKENLLLFGNPGAGKSHLLCALAHELIAQGRRMKYTTCTMLVQDLLVAKRDLRLSKEIKKLARYDAMIIDEMGYVQQSREEMEVLFTLLAERYERGSVLDQQSSVLEVGGNLQGPDDHGGGHRSAGSPLGHPGAEHPQLSYGGGQEDTGPGAGYQQLRGKAIGARCCWQALRSAPSGLRSGPASNNDRRGEKDVPTTIGNFGCR
jgi:DNA replication protein DnaC